MKFLFLICSLILPCLALCGSGTESSTYEESDRLFAQMLQQLQAEKLGELITEIDHSRLAKEAGSVMPPSRVLIWSDPKVDALILKENPMAALDLPFRNLAYQDPESGKSWVIHNEYSYLVKRYGLNPDTEAARRYAAAMKALEQELPPQHIKRFAQDSLQGTAWITLESPFSFQETEKRVLAGIRAQEDTVEFALVDFQQRSASEGVSLRPLRLYLFGGPAPGGKAMERAPTLGLDAFCQKLVIYEVEPGRVCVSFNDLIPLAKRQQVPVTPPLRIVNQRVQATFRKALKENNEGSGR